MIIGSEGRKVTNIVTGKEITTEFDAVRKEMTMEEIIALPNMLGRIASVKCKFHGEYKYMNTTKNEKTHIVLVEK